ncbi:MULTISPECIES: ImuA family protein [Gammaproteobacteria]|uniref:ImuA family protein n=1 Tax=Gammaproteobacteria TaxID=1236 RepID=UPI000DCF8945|nr:MULTISPECIES: hypothetical protein [Gammaproteobacteria]RTE86765.1 hypothetical protein DQX04_09460 [Aliidiomarina sp. B3213]TCZ90681.1 hypothetical protein EYQ95_07585 [Lysobacter sp. N42]
MAVNSVSLNRLMSRGDVWQGRVQQGSAENSGGHNIATGVGELDDKLHGGWQWQKLHEIQVKQPFSGEVVLLKNALAWSGAQKRPVFWIAPPALPCASGLARYVDPQSQHIVLTPQTEADALWSAEHILRSGSAGMVILWSSSLSQPACRRLHLAVQNSGAIAFVISDIQPEEARPFTTRLRLSTDCRNIEVIKRAQGWPVQVELHKPLHWLRATA